jgi:hypothetical protein
MLDRSRAEAASPRARALAYSVAAGGALAAAAWLAYTGVNYITDGCGCYDAIRDEVAGAVALALAGVSVVAAVALSIRALRLFRLTTDD